MSCPFCHGILEETFLHEYLPRLYPSGVWVCRICSYGKNRFDDTGKVIEVERVSR